MKDIYILAVSSIASAIKSSFWLIGWLVKLFKKTFGLTKRKLKMQKSDLSLSPFTLIPLFGHLV